MAGKINQRVALTKRLLKESLLELLKKKNVRNISVTELCNKAGINRSTFYAHYSIPADVLSEIKKDFADRIADSLKTLGQESSPRRQIVRVCECIYENRELEKVILSNSDDDEVLEAALESSFDIWGDTVPYIKENIEDPDAKRLFRVFYYHGIYRVIREWITGDIRKSPDEVAGILYEILFG